MSSFRWRAGRRALARSRARATAGPGRGGAGLGHQPASWLVWSGVGLMLASCGPALAVHIPTARTHPRLTQGRGAASPPAPGPVARVTSIAVAPGVAVPPVALAAPRVTVSSRYPPPPGTSVATVVADFLRDNAIENVALERGDASLLAYADGGDFLRAEQQLVLQQVRLHRTPVRISDSFTTLEVGNKVDPGSPISTVAIYVAGLETTVARTPAGVTRAVRRFADIFWCALSTDRHVYVIVDDAVLP